MQKRAGKLDAEAAEKPARELEKPGTGSGMIPGGVRQVWTGVGIKGKK